MKTIREQLEQQEEKIFSPWAQRSAKTKGRQHPLRECDIRPAFQRDRDRILHSKPFRRLKHKTQVFLSPTGDHYRTRMTHTLEVGQIARTVGKALRLNEDLIEAITLGHDLGHTPFGHAGEAALNKLYKPGFKHHVQSLRVVDELANDGKGLNLTYEVRNGIIKHSKGKGNILSATQETRATTLEGQIVRLADITAYLNHDVDDAIRAGMLRPEEIPSDILETLGRTLSTRIERIIKDMIVETQKAGDGDLHMTNEVLEAITKFRAFMFSTVYENPLVRDQLEKAQKILEALYNYYLEHPEVLDKEAGTIKKDEPLEVRICDFISGMTDRYAINKFQEIFLPKEWHVY